MRKRPLTVPNLLLGLGATAVVAGAAPDLIYSVYVLPVPPSSGALPNAINNSGMVVGYRGFGSQRRAWRWSASEGYRDWPVDYLTADDINNVGDVVILTQINAAPYEVRIWNPTSGVRLLPNPSPRNGPEVTYSNALRISDTGFVSGTYALDVGVGYLRGVRWDPWGTISIFDPSSEPTFEADYTEAIAINSSGDVIGRRCQAFGGPCTNILWPVGGPPIVIGGSDVQVKDVNNRQEVCGFVSGHTFTWTESAGLQMLPILPSGDVPEHPEAINNYGQVVGDGWLYQPAVGTVSLTGLLDPTSAGWSSIRPRDINDLGWIVGTGTNADAGLFGQTVLLRPPCHDGDVAPPYGTLTIDDVLTFLDAFSLANTTTADIAEPIGMLDIDDVLKFLSLFAEGCDPY